jgi:hypothetical protein
VQEEELVAMGQECMDLSDELWQMPEYKLYRDLQGIDISIGVFHRNYVASVTFLTFLASDERAAHLFVLRNHDSKSDSNAGSHRLTE